MCVILFLRKDRRGYRLASESARTWCRPTGRGKELDDIVERRSTVPLLSPGDRRVVPNPVDPLTFHFFYVRAALSAVILACALYVILSERFQPRDKHWAYGIVGTILGLWFRS